MVSINYAFREISCKIVYYGPGLSGKTTNLQCVHDRLPAKSRGDLISLATEADRTLYFDFLPLTVGEIGGFATKFQMYTVPGQVFYNATRKLVLRGVDGIVFVADSQNSKMDDNLESLADMHDNLKSYGLDQTQIPIVMQYNKRDLPDVASVAELEEKLNPDGFPYVEASAVNGTGVFDTVKRISKLVLEDIRRRTEKGAMPAAPEQARAATVEPGVPTSSGPIPVGGSSGGTAVVAAAQATSAATALATPSEIESLDAAAHSQVDAKPQLDFRTPAGRSRRPGPSRQSGTTIIAAQRSTRVRRRKRSLFERMFGWLFGR